MKACQQEVSNKNRLISFQKEELATMEIKIEGNGRETGGGEAKSEST